MVVLLPAQGPNKEQLGRKEVRGLRHGHGLPSSMLNPIPLDIISFSAAPLSQSNMAVVYDVAE